MRYLQEGRGADYATAVLRSATVPIGWIVGCPLLGAVSDRIGRRRPVILGGAVLLLGAMAWVLYGVPDVVPAYLTGLFVGFVSGVAMLLYTVVKETNPPQLGGTATGVINFVNMGLTAVLGPVFGGMLDRASDGGQRALEHYQSTFAPMLVGVAIAIGLTFLLKETGSRARMAAAAATAAVDRERQRRAGGRP